MKKIIVSAAVAALALTTTASALEDIKVNGQAKIWYETNGVGPTNELFNKNGASGEAVFKLGMTGKQGDVGFGATVYDTSTMGLEGNLVNGVRTNTNNLVDTDNDQMYVGEAYITAPVGGSTVLKLGKQELDTPFLFTERWNATPNTYNGAVAINSAIDNVTVIGAYVGQGSATALTLNTSAGFKSNGTANAQLNSRGAYTVAGLYKTDAISVNAWYYAIPQIADAFWVDASTKIAGLNVKAVVASMMPDKDVYADNTMAYALSAGTAVSGWKVSAAASMVSEDGLIPVGNVGTSFKKTKLPTAGVYTDGIYVAQPGSTAIKVKAAGKVGSIGVAVQAVNNTNSNATTFTSFNGKSQASLETTEIDVILTKKLGDFNLKGIIMNRSFADTASEDAAGGMYVRAIVGVNF